MTILFYIAAVITVVSTAMVVTRLNAVHGLLYLILSLLSVAVIFFILGAPFVAVLEVIIYAGAIMVLFLFVVMMLNLGPRTTEQERAWLSPKTWVMPGILGIILLVELVYLLMQASGKAGHGQAVGPKEVGMALYGPYVLGVELASMLLLAGLVGAYHLGRRRDKMESVTPRTIKEEA
jgi:NADH-quinone oxidoreductase subunit J